MGVMLGTVPTSVPQFILLGNWLLEGKFKEKWNNLRSNKLFWILSSVFLLHVIGLLYTTDLQAGWNDVRTKIPLIYLPLIYFTTAPLQKKEMHYLLQFFILGSFLNLTWCFIYSKILHHTEEVRNVSRFMSHIRLGFLIDLAIVFSIYFIDLYKQLKLKLLFVLLSIYFLASLYYLGLMSGLVNLACITFIFTIYFLFKFNKIIAFSIATLLLVSAGFIYRNIQNFYHSNFDVKQSQANQIKANSPSGRAYSSYSFAKQVENGYDVALNVQNEELQKEWNSRYPADSFNLQQQYNVTTYFTLLRYLASKGQCKDSVTVSQLTSQEGNDIRKGVTNYLYPNWSFINKRLYELFYDYYEYVNKGTVNGHSFSMRLFYLKAAFCAIEENKLLGTGTGDVQSTMNVCYEHSSSPLNKEWYKRPHNQFITITVALGIVGLIVFLISLFYPIIVLRKELTIVYWLFFASAIISFLFEDTLETQSGLSFFAIFNTLFITNAYFKKKQILQD